MAHEMRHTTAIMGSRPRVLSPGVKLRDTPTKSERSPPRTKKGKGLLNRLFGIGGSPQRPQPQSSAQKRRRGQPYQQQHMGQEEERKDFVRDDFSEFSNTRRFGRPGDHSPESAFGGARSARQDPLEALGISMGEHSAAKLN